MLIKAFKELLVLNPGRNIQLHIAGDGETMPQVKSLIEELELADSVKLHGMLNTSALVSFMTSLDIYVHATLGETLSNSIMQAMACGLPIIASDVWGVNNMITNGETGLLYEPGNTGDLAKKINSVIHDAQLRNRLATTARTYAEQHYDNKVMFRRYRELFLS